MRSVAHSIYRPAPLFPLPSARQVHEMISVTAIQEAQQSAVAAFEDFMDACMDSEWQQVGPGWVTEAGEATAALLNAVAVAG